ISEVFYEEQVHADPDAVQAIREADLIIYGVGSLYTSILPNIIIPEIREALKESKAERVYFCNAMTQPGETDGYDVEDHVNALRQHGTPVDAVIVPADPLPDEILQRYYAEGSTPVSVMEMSHDYEVIRLPLLNFENHLIRHDSQKIREAVEYLLRLQEDDD
ncbi:MAG: YvcK family protein, partial [Solobacterium sp.]|nr:YvcK family protein [Solobacterium sp.]